MEAPSLTAALVLGMSGGAPDQTRAWLCLLVFQRWYFPFLGRGVKGKGWFFHPEQIPVCS